MKVRIRKKMGKGDLLIEAELAIEKGEVIGLYGPSGGGKTSLLRMICGLDRPDSGCISLDDECWFDSESKVEQAVQQREVAMVFQDYPLFPTMNARKNLEYTCRSEKEKERIPELVKLLGMDAYLDRKVSELSGGQRQRIAVARCLLSESKLWLMDEPTAALDEELADQMLEYARKRVREEGKMLILVSHRESEMKRFSDRIYQLKDGELKVVEN